MEFGTPAICSIIVLMREVEAPEEERRPVSRRATVQGRVIRPVFTLILVLTATVLLVPSLLVNWTRTQIYDDQRFADSAVAALQEEVVRDALVRAIVDEITAVASPDAVTIRPLIEFVTTTVVDSLAFREIYRESVLQLHRQVFSQGQSQPVALTLVDAVIVIMAYLEQAFPEVARQVPPNLESSFIQIRNRDWAVRAVAFGEGVTELAVILPVVTGLLYGAAVLLSRNRRQTLLFIGFGWIAVAAFLVIARDFARGLVLADGFPDPAVSEAVWSVYTNSLLGWAAILGGLGLLLAVAATGVHRADPVRQWQLLVRGLSYTPTSPAMKVVRGASFILAGVLVVTQREEVLQITVLLAAAYLVYYGLSELVWLAGGRTTEVTPSGFAGMRVIAWRRSLALRAGAVVTLAAIAVAGVFVADRAFQTAGGEVVALPVIEACNGHRQLCDRRLDEVVYLGTHNSMAAASEPGWYFASHLTGIRAQLEAGVRVLLIDTYYGYATGNGVRSAGRDFVAESFPPDEFSQEVIDAARRLAGTIGGVDAGDPLGTYLCHVFCELGATPFTQSLAEINRFLSDNPGEVVILQIQDQITPEDTARAFVTSGLVQRVYEPVEGEPLPTLRELIEMDKRVLVFADTDASGVDWYKESFKFIHDTPFRVERETDFTCEHGRGDPDAPFFAMNHWLSQSFPSTYAASRINTFDFIYRRVQECHRTRERKVNFVIVNFYEIGDAAAVVDYLNGVGQRPPLE